MFSILVRHVVSVCFKKTNELILRPRLVILRPVHTSKALASRISYKSRMQELNLTQGVKFSKDPDDLGKVVEYDLEDLQLEDLNNNTRKRKEQKKKLKAEKTPNDKSVVKGNEESNDKNEIKGNEESNDKNEIKKKKFEDLRKKNLNPFSDLMTTIKSKNGREKTQQIYLEGKRLIQDAIKAGHVPLKIFFSKPSDLEMLNLPEGIEVYRIPYKKLQFWSDVVTSQGVVGIFKMPNLSILNKKNTKLIPLTIVCDNVREPSNLGSILRVVASVGCEKLILTQGCVDIWEPKVLRSAAGAHFHLPVLRNIPWTEIEKEIPEDYKVVLASCDAKDENSAEKENSVFSTKNKISESLPLKCYSFVDYKNQGTAIVVGGETKGLSSEAIEFAIKRKGMRVFIPMSNQVESLNNAVALGILSYMIRHQLESSVNSSSCAEQEKHENNDEVN